jgi:hypothetical protein
MPNRFQIPFAENGFLFNIFNIRDLKLTIKPNQRNLFALFGSLGLSYVAYKTLVVYIKRRKYRHIPGPRTYGFNLFLKDFLIKKKPHFN